MLDFVANTPNANRSTVKSLHIENARNNWNFAICGVAVIERFYCITHKNELKVNKRIIDKCLGFIVDDSSGFFNRNTRGRCLRRCNE